VVHQAAEILGVWGINAAPGRDTPVGKQEDAVSLGCGDERLRPGSNVNRASLPGVEAGREK